MTAALTVEALEFGYAGSPFRLSIPALSVEAGEQVAVVGPSGSGKSTLLDLVAGIRLPARGRVVAHGLDLAAAGDAERRAFRARSVGFVFQDFALLEHLSVRENALVAYHVDPGLTLDAAVEARLVDLARSVGIEELLERKPGTLSGGERQRAALCRALVTEPRLCLADEPTGNLDARSGASVLDCLQREARRRGATLLVVTHDRDALGRFDRVLDLRELARAGGVPG